MTQYGKGNYYEQRTVVLFEHDGYHCWQVRGSKGKADIIAAKPGQLVLVQVKSIRERVVYEVLDHEEWNGLYRLAVRLAAVPVVAVWRPRPVEAGGSGLVMTLRRMTGLHERLKHTWPHEPWHLDELEAAARRAGSNAPPVETAGPR